ncbi:hypothetical protein MANES_16G066600v8 [Manihot esculenta]|uniref:Uncharacterized protein n=1 Tax=Manihot esculenta TaxID=3983 RepID=A0ACB7G6L5_MANES|nr:hypothetical protein MANES_16G066600v8 [Manihot esculenta]
MEFHLQHIFVFLTIMAVTSHAALSPEQYWKTVLPSTPMPGIVKHLLHPDFMDEKSTSVIVGGKGVGVDAEKTEHKGNPIYVAKFPFFFPYNNVAAAPENQLPDPNATVFFLKKDMYPGKTMNLHFPEILNVVTFLPRRIANSIPFSSNKLPKIYNQFSIKQGSMEAEIMKKTIRDCEDPGIKGEVKYCATSVESMIDFSTNILGKNVQTISTDVNQIQLQKYTITTGAKKIGSDKMVTCHMMSYTYAVFYCHTTQNTTVYRVSLEGADGTKTQVAAVCHSDTSAWDPKHLAFQLLKVKPGTVSICHFLPQDHLAWVPK